MGKIRKMMMLRQIERDCAHFARALRVCHGHRQEACGSLAIDSLQKLLGFVSALSVAQLVTLDATVRGRLAVPRSRPGDAIGDAAAEVPSAGAMSLAGASVPLAGPADAGVTSVAGLEARFALAPTCPHCQGSSVIKWNKASGLQRYLCKPCGRTFNALTGTPLAQLHKRELWLGHAQALVEGILLRKVTTRLDVDLTTAFRWRHRFLKAPGEVRPTRIEGTVEADETRCQRDLRHISTVELRCTK